MDIDRWEQLKTSLKGKFDVEEEGREDLTMDTQDGEVVTGSSDFMVMQTPVGRIKLALVKKPVVLGKKEHFSHRAGQAARVEYEFSESEFSHKLHAYKWNDMDEEWEEIDAENFR
jgi:hypothetical protein